MISEENQILTQQSDTLGDKGASEDDFQQKVTNILNIQVGASDTQEKVQVQGEAILVNENPEETSLLKESEQGL